MKIPKTRKEYIKWKMNQKELPKDFFYYFQDYYTNREIWECVHVLYKNCPDIFNIKKIKKEYLRSTDEEIFLDGMFLCKLPDEEWQSPKLPPAYMKEFVSFMKDFVEGRI